MIYPVVITPQWRPVLDARTPVQWGAFAPSDSIPANAIYANGEPIPDQSGGYLRYGAST